jgi:hypothetical protein
MSQSSQWNMLKDALRDAIMALPGYRVTHALFTTYAFEPEFFETAILPLLLPDGGAGLSLHSVVRRLQMESMLRTSPMTIDVYFDARVVVPGCPFLPYNMLPVRLEHEFHGKLILLRLEDEQGQARCVLGAGSANLTKAGWWENVEVWHFAKAFDPARPPAGLLPGIEALLNFLAARGRPGEATGYLTEVFANARPRRRVEGEPIFGVFNPGGESFLKWIGKWTDDDDTRLEVISPYFAESGHAALVSDLLDATGSEAVDVWLPEDPWQAGGPAVLMEESTYDDLKAAEMLRWCQMDDAKLVQARHKEQKPPRFLHAKLIRKPGHFCFMGSVNFSNKAMRSNFEAGFLFPDDGGTWLAPLTQDPQRFLKPAEQACHADVDESAPEVWASFNWQTRILKVAPFTIVKDIKNRNVTVRLLDAQGTESGLSITLPGSMTLPLQGPLYRDLQTNPWIRLVFPDGTIALAWVQQCALEYRPPPVDLQPDVWRILEMWRSLAEGGAGSGPVDLGPLEVLLNRRGEGGDAPPGGELEQNIFEEMATAHGSFYLLRRRLQTERALGNVARCEYYLSAPRPDSLTSLIDRIEHTSEESPVEPIAAWVMLQWVIQICRDHKHLSPAKSLCQRAEGLLTDLVAREPLSALDPIFLEWTQRMFLCAPGKERSLAKHFAVSEEPK